MILNTTYAHTHVGTGVYTRNMLVALPEARRLRLPARLLASNAAAFWTRRAAETAMSAIPSTVFHPYWATDLSSRHVISVLDFVQFHEATATERQVLARAARGADAVLVLSRAVASQIEWPRPRVVVAPPFPDDAWFDTPLTPRRPSTSGPIRIGYFGGWHSRKGMPTLLEALGRSSITSDVEIHCTGRTPRDTPRGLRIVTHGSLPTAETVALVDSCHVVVYPSIDEGYGLPVVEALLRERPLICRDLPVYREFVQHAGALHVPACWDDPNEIAIAIETAVASPPLRRYEALVAGAASRDRAVTILRSALFSAREALS